MNLKNSMSESKDVLLQQQPCEQVQWFLGVEKENR